MSAPPADRARAVGRQRGVKTPRGCPAPRPPPHALVGSDTEGVWPPQVDGTRPHAAGVEQRGRARAALSQTEAAWRGRLNNKHRYFRGFRPGLCLEA